MNLENFSIKNNDTKEFINSLEKVIEIAKEGKAYFENPKSSSFFSTLPPMERKKQIIIYYKDLINKEFEKALEQEN